ncbi:hypothetical protein HNR53_003659 [Bacillus benzoevorans]|uniref:Uncharacterized protein n=1 Tax=Bacillus benzoevorans TaxID=1456 RepID=A0A7X0HUA8_9BACI|nr:hypothetical protein [Bacillus benzoevorans]
MECLIIFKIDTKVFLFDNSDSDTTVTIESGFTNNSNYAKGNER